MLLDDVMEAGHDAENDPHPEEGCLVDGIFVRVEHDDEFTYCLRRYKDVTIQHVLEDNFHDGEALIQGDSWYNCEEYFNRAIKVMRGEMDEKEFEEEIKNIKKTASDVKVAPPQGSPTSPQKKTATLKDCIQVMHDIGVSSMRPVYEIQQEITEELDNRDIEMGWGGTVSEKLDEILNEFKNTGTLPDIPSDADDVTEDDDEDEKDDDEEDGTDQDEDDEEEEEDDSAFGEKPERVHEIEEMITALGGEENLPEAIRDEYIALTNPEAANEAQEKEELSQLEDLALTVGEDNLPVPIKCRLKDLRNKFKEETDETSDEGTEK